MNYEVEYEIPPLRAIYSVIVENVRDMAHARVFVQETNPTWKIRKLTNVDHEPIKLTMQGEKMGDFEKPTIYDSLHSGAQSDRTDYIVFEKQTTEPTIFPVTQFCLKCYCDPCTCNENLDVPHSDINQKLRIILNKLEKIQLDIELLKMKEKQ